jgi:hypothetical protein
VVLLVNLLILIGLPLIFYAASWYMLNPLSSKGLRYEFKGGESSTWYSVQFYLKTGTTEIKGPWIGGGTLRLEFDDLNDDGQKDIKIIGTNGNAVEILFTPDKAKIWTIINAKGYKVTWSEDGYNFG